jgi:hypothetical protein
MGIKTAITNLHREEARQERRGEKVVMRDLKYHENYVWKYSVVLAGNYPLPAINLRIYNK